LDQGQGRISRRVRELPDDDDLAEAGSETAPADYRWRCLSACGAACHPLRDGWVPIAGRAPYGDVNEYLTKFKQMVAEAGRPSDAVPITLFGAMENANLMKRYRDMGVARVVTTLPPEPAERTLPVLDRWGELTEASTRDRRTST
jgi:hypothetical protein